MCMSGRECVCLHYNILNIDPITLWILLPVRSLHPLGRLSLQIKAIPRVTVFASKANFILVRVPDAKRSFDGLLSHGILVKNVSNSHPLLANCLRITIGNPEENAALLTAFRASL